MALIESLHARVTHFLRSKKRPPFEAFYIYFFTLLLGYSAADLSVLYFRPAMLPENPPPAKPIKRMGSQRKSLAEYNEVTGRNIFNSDGEIPPALSEADQGPQDVDGPAVASNLPLKLLGTIASSNEKISVASIHISNRNKSAAFKVGDEIDGLAEVKKIERKKVTFRNLNNRRMEYIEIPEDLKLSFDVSAPKKSGQVEKTGKFEFTLNRKEVEKHLEDLPSLMKPDVVRMFPNKVNGQIQGFRFTRIGSGSVYDQLGFKVGDVLKSVEGEDLDDFSKGLELFEKLKSSNNIELIVERNGQEETFRYNIN